MNRAIPWVLVMVAGCAGKPPSAAQAPAKEAHAAAAQDDKQPWNGGRGSICEPGQVNDLGVGRACSSHADCAGFKMSMCHGLKGPDRPRVCTVHCETDADCGPDAMCGLSRGWLRSCYPTRCTDFAYDPNKTRPMDGPPPTHAGAAICDAGVSLYPEEGWGDPCSEMGECGERPARACNAAIYPPGVPYCLRECRYDSQCGDNAYCGYTEVDTFTLCAPRCPEARHRQLMAKPDQLDRCKMAGSIAHRDKNAHGIGGPCADDAGCGEGGICGSSVNAKIRPVGCTRACSADSDCGRNALCVDVEHSLPDTDKTKGATTYCISACWGV